MQSKSVNKLDDQQGYYFTSGSNINVNSATNRNNASRDNSNRYVNHGPIILYTSS